MADEIQQLAERTRGSTNKIGTILKAVAESGSRSAVTKIREGVSADQSQASRHLHEATSRMSDRIADASRTMLEIAQANDSIAREFNTTVQNLVSSGRDFESEVSRFRFRADN